MKFRVPLFFLLFLLGILLIPEPSHTLVMRSPETIGSYTFNWQQFWKQHNTLAQWQLQWLNPLTDSWMNRTNLLIVKNTRTYENSTTSAYKTSLNFTSSRSGDYRLVVVFKKFIMQYVNRTAQFQFNLTYHDHSLLFDWTDLFSIPNLIIKKGVTWIDNDENGTEIEQPYFWFMIRRNNVPANYNLYIDPTTIGTSSTGAATSQPPQRKTFKTTVESFGYTTIGSSFVGLSANYKSACKFQNTRGSVNLLEIRARIWFSVSGYAKAGIYSDSSGVPSALLGSSSEVSVETSATWVKFTFSPLALSNATNYWLAVIFSQPCSIATDAGASNQFAYNGDTYSDGFSNPFGSPTYGAYKASIFAVVNSSTTGKYWAFYSDGTDMVFRTSTDATTWSSSTAVRTSSVGESFSIGYYPSYDNLYFYYVYSIGTTNTPLLYRRMAINESGTGLTLGTEYTVLSGSIVLSYKFPNLGIVTNGTVFVGCDRGTSGNHRWVKIANLNNDGSGTWTLDATFSSTALLDTLFYYHGTFEPLTNGKMLAVFGSGGVLPSLRSRYYTGTGWNAEVTVAGSSDLIRENFATTVDSSDNVYVSYAYISGTYNPRFKKWRYANTTWLSEEVVSSIGTDAMCASSITVNATSHDVWVFFKNSSYTQVMYAKRTNATSSWATTQWFTGETGILSYSLTSFRQAVSNKIGVMWSNVVVGFGSNVRYAVLDSLAAAIQQITVILNQIPTTVQTIVSRKKLYRSFNQEVIVIQTMDSFKRLFSIFNQESILVQNLDSSKRSFIVFNQISEVTQEFLGTRTLTFSFDQVPETIQEFATGRIFGQSFHQLTEVTQDFSTQRIIRFDFNQFVETIQEFFGQRIIRVDFNHLTETVQEFSAMIRHRYSFDFSQLTETIMELFTQRKISPTFSQVTETSQSLHTSVGVLQGFSKFVMWVFIGVLFAIPSGILFGIVRRRKKSNEGIETMIEMW